MGSRILYFDLTKAYTIFSVIAYHVAICMHLEIVSIYFDTYFLSLFFFISGLWLDENDVRTLNDWMKVIKNNFIRLILPFFVCMTLYSCFQIVIRGGQLGNVFNYWLSDAKGGGWFLVTLFVFIVVAKLLNAMLSILEVRNMVVKIIFFLLPLLFVILCSSLLDNKLYYALSMPSFRRYWLLFICGFFTKNIFGIEFATKNFAVSVIGYISCAIYYILYVGDVKNNVSFIIWLVTNLFGCFFYLSLFKRLSNNYRVPNVFLKIGQNTLGIYMLHYFFYYMYYLVYPILAEKLSLSMRYCVMLLVSILILILTFVCVRILDKSPVTSLLLFGKRQKKYENRNKSNCIRS